MASRLARLLLSKKEYEAFLERSKNLMKKGCLQKRRRIVEKFKANTEYQKSVEFLIKTEGSQCGVQSLYAVFFI